SDLPLSVVSESSDTPCVNQSEFVGAEIEGTTFDIFFIYGFSVSTFCAIPILLAQRQVRDCESSCIVMQSFWSSLLMTCRVSKTKQKAPVRLPRTRGHFGPGWRVQFP